MRQMVTPGKPDPSCRRTWPRTTSPGVAVSGTASVGVRVGVKLGGGVGVGVNVAVTEGGSVGVSGVGEGPICGCGRQAVRSRSERSRKRDMVVRES